MRGIKSKNLTRLWKATQVVRTYPQHWGQPDEILKQAKPVSGKVMCHLLSGQNYAMICNENRYWFFSDRPHFNVNERYYIELVHEMDKPSYLFIRKA